MGLGLRGKGEVPTLGKVDVEEKEDRAKWGITERVGCAAYDHPMEVVRNTNFLATTDMFFALPDGAPQALDMAALAAAAEERPSVRYVRLAKAPAGFPPNSHRLQRCQKSKSLRRKGPREKPPAASLSSRPKCTASTPGVRCARRARLLPIRTPAGLIASRWR